jgi:hypothetical protein
MIQVCSRKTHRIFGEKNKVERQRSTCRSMTLDAALLLRSMRRSTSFIRNDFETPQNQNPTRRPFGKNRPALGFLLRFSKPVLETS